MTFQWTPEDDAYIRENYGKVSYADMARKLKVDRSAVRWRAIGMGITTPGGCMADNARDNAYMERMRRELYG